MAREIPERYRWAAEVLDVGPGEHILEIGCGYGHMIGLVCDRLKSGHITAIDRSEAMIRAANERNKPHLESGKAKVLRQDLLDSRLPPASFDKVFLFNINAFWMDPVSELAEVKRLLKPSGGFYIFHQPPPGHEIGEFVERFRLNLTKNRFEVRSAAVSVVEGNEMACVISRSSHR